MKKSNIRDYGVSAFRYYAMAEKNKKSASDKGEKTKKIKTEIPKLGFKTPKADEKTKK